MHIKKEGKFEDESGQLEKLDIIISWIYRTSIK